MPNFTMFVGDSFKVNVAVVDESGDPVDISGTLIRWWLAKTVKKVGGEVLVKKDTTSGDIEITNGFGGLFTVNLDPPDTEGIRAGNYYHEAEIIDAGMVSTVLIGQATLRPTLVKPV